MAVWTTATRTWAAGEVVTAANLNAQLRDFANGFGAWGSYTPAVTTFTLGNGTVSGVYFQVQKFVTFESKFTFGSTSAVGTSFGMGLPVTAVATIDQYGNIRGTLFKNGSAAYIGLVSAATTAASVLATGASGVQTNITATVPFTWAANDRVHAAGTYQAA